MIVVHICAMESDDAARNVGNTPSTAQGCRPISANTQPNSIANHGSGIMATANLRNQVLLNPHADVQ